MTNERPVPVANPSVAQAERPHFSRRVFKLENPANIGPLVHIALWLGLLSVGLLVPGVTNWYVAVPLIVLLSLLNLSITIGVLHMHTHRPLFTSARMNRVADFLCCLPGGSRGRYARGACPQPPPLQ